MTTFRLEIETDNDAFGENPEGEVGRILQDVASRLAWGDADAQASASIRDFNGNRVGEWRFTSSKKKLGSKT